MNYSLIIGIEHFTDPGITTVGQAINDAKAIAAAFKEFGFEGAGQLMLLNDKATRTSVEYELKQILNCALEDDSVIVFFSSHGCSVAGQSYLVCHDSRHKDLPGTSIPIREVFKLMDSTRSRRVMLFLDCCHAGLQFPKEEKGILGNMSDAEISAFFAGSEYRVAFASCADTEKSYWSGVLGHGVWTHVLLQALTGKVRHILEGGRYLRAAHLQDYLHQQVPITLRDTLADKRIQNPRFYGSLNNNFLVADLGPLLAKTVKGLEEIGPLLKYVSFRHVEKRSVRHLPGFKKQLRHTEPSYYNQNTQDFVARIGAERVEERADALYEAIKYAFGYIRREIRIDKYGAAATIKAKHFDLNLDIHQSKNEPSNYIEFLSVSNFSSGEAIMSDAFNKVFAGEVSTLHFEFSTAKDIVVFIDQVERAKESRMQLEYASDSSCCKFTIEGVDARFTLRPKSLSVSVPGRQPKQMVLALIQASKAALLDAANVSLLPPPANQ